MSPVFARCGATAARPTARASSSWRRSSRRRAFAGWTSRTTPTQWATGRWRTSPPSWSSATAASSSTGPSSPTTSISGACSSLWKKRSDRLLDRNRRGARIRLLADRPPDHDVVRTGGERLGDVDRAFLIVGFFVLHGTNSWGDDQQALPELSLQPRGLEPRGDHAIAARLQRAARPRQNELFYRFCGTHFVQVALIEAGEHRDGENLQIALFLRRGLHHGAMPVHREEGRAAVAQVGDRAAHGLGNVVELEVGEHLVAAPGEPGDELEAARRAEELEADLVELHRIAEPLDQRARLGRGGQVEGHDQPLGARYWVLQLCHGAVSFAEICLRDTESDASMCFQCSASRSPVRSGSSTKAR